MLTAADFIHLPYTPDLTQAGVTAVCRWLAHNPAALEGSLFPRLRSLVAGRAVELAFRRYLVAQAVPHRSLSASPFSDPDHFDISLGGRRVIVQACLVQRKPAIRALRREPARLLGAAALALSEQAASEYQTATDLYLFAFVTGLVAGNRTETLHAIEAGQPALCLHPMPAAWAQPEGTAGLGELALKSDCDNEIRVEISGGGAGGGFLSEMLSLPPRQRVPVREQFQCLAHLRTERPLDGRLGVHSSRLNRTHLIAPYQWGNLWVYGLEIILAGYLTCAEFERRAAHPFAGMRRFPYEQVPAGSLSAPVAGLHPVAELLQGAKEWAEGRSQTRLS